MVHVRSWGIKKKERGRWREKDGEKNGGRERKRERESKRKKRKERERERVSTHIYLPSSDVRPRTSRTSVGDSSSGYGVWHSDDDFGGWEKWDIGLEGVFVVGGCKEGVVVVGPVYLASGEWVWVDG